MPALMKFLEKTLSSLLMSFLIFFASFSFMTGRFPPRKEDMTKAWVLGREMFVSTREYNQKVQAGQAQAPNLEQMVEMQKIALRRSEASLKLTQLMARIPQNSASPEVAAQLDKVTESLNQADEILSQLNLSVQKMTEAKK